MAKKTTTKKTTKKKEKVEKPKEEVKNEEAEKEITEATPEGVSSSETVTVESEVSEKIEEKAETQEKQDSNAMPEGAPDITHCRGEFQTDTHWKYKIKHEHVDKYGGKKTIMIEKNPTKN